MVFKFDCLNEILIGALHSTSNGAVFSGDLLTSGGSLVSDKEELSRDGVLLVANGTMIHGTTDGKKCSKYNFRAFEIASSINTGS